MIIYLIRHGETKPNKEKIVYYNNPEAGLTEKGIQQAKNLTRYLKDIDLIYSSPYKRAVQTAKLISRKKIIIDERLKEIDFGIFDGHSKRYVYNKYRKIYLERKKNKFHYQIPGGESYEMVFNRVLSFLHDIYSNKRVAIVTHATTIKLFLYILTTSTLEEIEKVRYPNACMLQLEIKKVNGKFVSNMINSFL